MHPTAQKFTEVARSFGLDTKLPTYVDEDLEQCDMLWAAAGTPHAVFAITPQDLVRVTDGSVADLKADT